MLLTNEVVHKYAMLSNWVDVCLIMVLVVVCVWLNECVMTLSDRLCADERVGFVATARMVTEWHEDCVNKGTRKVV